MTPSDIENHIAEMRKYAAELEGRLADPAIYADQAESRRVSKEHRRLTEIMRIFDRWATVAGEVGDNLNLLETEDDAELKSMIETDLERLRAEGDKLESDIRLALIPPDPNDDRDIIVEIRPAAGGDESALFAGDLFRAYSRYAEERGWKQEVLDISASDLGGVKEVVFSLSGDNVFAKMKYESGVHRVQRIPTTESGGRIHTSTVTVAVMPEAAEVEIEVRNEDLRFDVFRSSGPGGQCVNTTDSAVRVTHIPTGLSVASQQEKSQHRNKEIALRILRARLFEAKQREEAAKQADAKRAQVGTGDRSERIRTYNFPQNRITDHRYGISVHDLPGLLNGNLDMIVDPIVEKEAGNRLATLV